jgi:hypothetical protein
MQDRILEVPLRIARLLALSLVVVLGLAAAAHGERVIEGNVEVSFDGGISPHSLPRTNPAPVAVSIDSSFQSTDGADPPPQLRRISIGINRNGKLYDHGLPTCRIHEIQPATIAAARRICGGAIVGSGHVEVRVLLSNQPPFTFDGPLLVFNAERSAGHRRLLAQVYGSRPPSAFVLTFKVLRQAGTFGTVIRTTLPKSAWKWAYVTHFDMRLHRMYTYRGKRRSFVSAACAAPPGFPGALYQFARANFEFAEGQRASVTLNRDCAVAG